MKKACTCPSCGHVWTPGRKKMVRPRVSAPPQKPNDRSRMWSSMRVLRLFTAPDIVATAESGLIGTRVYINALIQAGYVRMVRETTFEVGDHSVYRLIRDTGPLAPRLRADGKTLLDLNTNAEVPRRHGASEAVGAGAEAGTRSRTHSSANTVSGVPRVR